MTDTEVRSEDYVAVSLTTLKLIKTELLTQLDFDQAYVRSHPDKWDKAKFKDKDGKVGT